MASARRSARIWSKMFAFYKSGKTFEWDKKSLVLLGRTTSKLVFPVSNLRHSHKRPEIEQKQKGPHRSQLRPFGPLTWLWFCPSGNQCSPCLCLQPCPCMCLQGTRYRIQHQLQFQDIPCHTLKKTNLNRHTRQSNTASGLCRKKNKKRQTSQSKE